MTNPSEPTPTDPTQPGDARGGESGDTTGMPDEGPQDEEAVQKLALVNSSTDEELRGADQ